MYFCLKRFFDILLSALGLVLLSPVFLVCALLIRLTSPGPALFTQKRAGRNGTYFIIYKFRTMYCDAPMNIPTQDLQDPFRFITPIGSFLRMSSLDELPQLLNILRGDMSIIGPRPALFNELELIAARKAVNVDSVRPGLTGLAQISGRDELEQETKVRLDNEYVSALHAGFFSALRMDARCFFGTFASVLRHDGFVEGGTGALHKRKDTK